MFSPHFHISFKKNPLNKCVDLFKRQVPKLRTDTSRLLSAGFFHVLIITICVRGAGFFQQVGLTRILDPYDYGKFIYVFRVLALVCVIADLGVSTSLLKFSAEPVAESRKNNIYRSSVVTVACVSFATAIIFCLCTFLSNGYGAKEDLLLPLMVGSLYIPIAALNKLPTRYMQAQKQIKRASMISGRMHLILLVLILVSAYLFHFWGVLLAMIAGQCLILSVFMTVTYSPLKAGKTDFSLLKTMVSFGFFSMLANCSGLINATMGVLLLKVLGHSYHEIAIYGVATLVVEGVRLIPQGFLRTTFPYMASKVNDSILLKKSTREIVLKQGVAVTIISLLTSLCGYWFLPLVFGENYRESWFPMVILLTSLTFWSFGAGYGRLQMILNKVKLNFVISFLQLVLNAGLALILIPDFGLVGAATALSVSYGVHMVLLCLSGERLLKIHAREEILSR